MPKKTLVAIIIVLGIGLGTGLLIFGLMVPDEKARPAFTAGGGTLLASSTAAFVAMLCGAFRGLDDLDE